MKSRNSILLLMVAVLLVAACAPSPRVYFKPQIGFRPTKTVAIMPFANLSGKEDAGKQVANAFLVELLKKPFFNVIEPGEVDEVLREERIRSSENIDKENAMILRDKLGADYVMVGAVNEYDYIQKDNRRIPNVGFSVRLIDTSTGEIVWAATHSRKGDDRELIFGWRVIDSLTSLTQSCVSDVMKRLKIHS